MPQISVVSIEKNIWVSTTPLKNSKEIRSKRDSAQTRQGLGARFDADTRTLAKFVSRSNFGLRHGIILRPEKVILHKYY